MCKQLKIFLLLAFLPSLAEGGFAATFLGSVTITGVERSSAGVWDAGTVTATFNGLSVSVGYGQYSTAASIASGLAAMISNSCSFPVYAQATGAVINFYQKGTNQLTSATISSASRNGFLGSSFPLSGTGSGGGFCSPLIEFFQIEPSAVNQGDFVNVVFSLEGCPEVVSYADCSVKNESNVSMQTFRLDLYGSTTQKAGADRFSSGLLTGGTYSVICTGYVSTGTTFPGGTPLTTPKDSDPEPLTVAGSSASCTGAEDPGPTVSLPPSTTSQGPFTYQANITLPYKTSDGSSGSFTSSAQGVTDASDEVDCDGDRIYATAHAPTVDIGDVYPELHGQGTVTFNWSITAYTWPDFHGLKYCDCVGCEPNTCTKNGVDDPATITPVAHEPSTFTQTANCKPR